MLIQKCNESDGVQFVSTVVMNAITEDVMTQSQLVKNCVGRDYPVAPSMPSTPVHTVIQMSITV